MAMHVKVVDLDGTERASWTGVEGTTLLKLKGDISEQVGVPRDRFSLRQGGVELFDAEPVIAQTAGETVTLHLVGHTELRVSDLPGLGLNAEQRLPRAGWKIEHAAKRTMAVRTKREELEQQRARLDEELRANAEQLVQAEHEEAEARADWETAARVLTVVEAATTAQAEADGIGDELLKEGKMEQDNDRELHASDLAVVFGGPSGSMGQSMRIRHPGLGLELLKEAKMQKDDGYCQGGETSYSAHEGLTEERDEKGDLIVYLSYKESGWGYERPKCRLGGTLNCKAIVSLSDHRQSLVLKHISLRAA